MFGWVMGGVSYCWVATEVGKGAASVMEIL